MVEDFPQSAELDMVLALAESLLRSSAHTHHAQERAAVLLQAPIKQTENSYSQAQATAAVLSLLKGDGGPQMLEEGQPGKIPPPPSMSLHSTPFLYSITAKYHNSIPLRDSRSVIGACQTEELQGQSIYY